MTRQRTETETKNVCPKPGFSFIDTHRRQYNERTFGTPIRYICRPKHKLYSPRLPLLIKTAFKNGYYCVNLFGSPELKIRQMLKSLLHWIKFNVFIRVQVYLLNIALQYLFNPDQPLGILWIIIIKSCPTSLASNDQDYFMLTA